jgi:hypothetical protein
MARIRSIKPEFWTSEQVAECSPDARLLFIGLWNFCDDNGIHPASYRRAKMEVFPSDAFTVDDIKALVQELYDAIDDGGKPLLREYTVAGRCYWEVTGWHQHQRVEKPYFRYPLDDGIIPHSSNGRRTVDERSDTILPRIRNGTETEMETDTVRPFVASDHFDCWTEARRRAAETAKRLWPSGRPQPTTESEREERKEDNELILKLAFLSLALFTDGWLADAMAAATSTKRKKKVDNRLGYLKGTLRKKAQKAGYVLNDLLDAIQIPPKEPPAKPLPEASQLAEKLKDAKDV